MYSRVVTVVNPTGLHARPAAEFARAAARFGSDIRIGPADSEARVNAKSVVMVLSMGMGQGVRVELSARGADERQAVDFLAALIQDGLGEL